MASHNSPNLFRLNSLDRHGRKIDPAVLIAAQDIFPRALEHGLNMFCDPAIIANVLEEVAADVSRRLEKKDESENASDDPRRIRNLSGYVFHSFVRQLNRLKSKELVVVSADATDMALTSRWADPSAQFETKILVDECLAQFDFVTRDMFWRCVQGFTWEDIGKIHGLSGHVAEVRFRRAVQAAHARLTNERRSLPCRTPADPTEEPKPAMRIDAKKQTTGI